MNVSSAVRMPLWGNPFLFQKLARPIHRSGCSYLFHTCNPLVGQPKQFYWAWFRRTSIQKQYYPIILDWIDQRNMTMIANVSSTTPLLEPPIKIRILRIFHQKITLLLWKMYKNFEFWRKISYEKFHLGFLFAEFWISVCASKMQKPNNFLNTATSIFFYCLR